MTINKTWFEEHKSYIEQLYMDQYVAIYNCQVFASDKNLQRLIDLFADECGEDDVYFGYIGEKPTS
jgi:hypothetical protein